MANEPLELERALDARRRRDSPTAIRLLRGLVRGHPDAALYSLLLGDELLATGCYAEAVSTYQDTLQHLVGGRCAELPPGASRAEAEALVRGHLATALVGAGDLPRAQDQAARAATLDPRPSRCVAAGEVAEMAGRRDIARRWYLRALALDRGDADACAHLGSLCFWERPAAAERRYRRALRRNRRHEESLSGLGFQALIQGDLDLAERLLVRAVRAGRSARPRIYLGHVHEERGRLDEAARSYLEAQRVDPADPHPLYALGDLERRRSRPDAARAAYAEALRMAPECADAALRLGLLLAEAYGEDAEALDLVRQGLALAPHHPWAEWLAKDVLPDLEARAAGAGALEAD